MFENIFSLIKSFCHDYNISFANLTNERFANRRSIEVKIGNTSIGGGSDILVQSMTNTRTSDVKSTFAQCCKLIDCGSELVRLSVVDKEDADAIPTLRKQLNESNRLTPLALCMHFNGHSLLDKAPHAIEYAQKIRINPGNVGLGKARDVNLESIVASLKKAERDSKEKKSLRIGANYGSIDHSVWQKVISFSNKFKKNFSKDEIDISSLIISTLISKNFLNSIDLPDNQIVISCKLSDARNNFIANKILSELIINPLHIGVTECGIGQSGIINATSGISSLLMYGIGDTIRCSLTSFDELDRTTEVNVCYDILNAIGKRKKSIRIISCPGCGRTNVKFFANVVRELELLINKEVEQKLKNLSVSIKVAIMGCIVNGPGESKSADIGISLTGRDEDNYVIYVKGKKFAIVKNKKDVLSKFNQAVDYFLEYTKQALLV